MNMHTGQKMAGFPWTITRWFDDTAGRAWEHRAGKTSEWFFAAFAVHGPDPLAMRWRYTGEDCWNRIASSTATHKVDLEETDAEGCSQFHPELRNIAIVCLQSLMS